MENAKKVVTEANNTMGRVKKKRNGTIMPWRGLKKAILVL